MSDNANQWNHDEMLEEARFRVRDQSGELVSRQALAVLEVCAEQLQALWAEVNRQHERICALEFPEKEP